MEQTSPEEDANQFSLDHPYLKNRVVILNGFTDTEIVSIMRAVKALCRPGPEGEEPSIAAPSRDLVFAKTTPNSLQTVLGALIIDMSGDHEYLQKNPPQRGKPA